MAISLYGMQLFTLPFDAKHVNLFGNDINELTKNISEAFDAYFFRRNPMRLISAMKKLMTYSVMFSISLPLLAMDLDTDRDIKAVNQRRYLQAKKLLEPMGYVVEQHNDGSYQVSFPPLRRSQQDIETLRYWGFTDDDIARLTIRNILDPLNDVRILQAHRPDIGHGIYRFTFRLFASRLLWPNDPSEADLLLLIPFLRKISSEIEDSDCYSPNSLLALAIQKRYFRVIRLLTMDPMYWVNTQDQQGMTPLERACRGSNYAAVQMLLNSECIDINERTRAIVREQAQKRNYELLDLFIQHERKKGTQISVDASGSRVPVIADYCGHIVPIYVLIPDDVLAHYKKKHAKFLKDAEKRGERITTEPPHRSIKSLVAWSLSIPAIAAAAKLGHHLYDQYYKPKKKDSL